MIEILEAIWCWIHWITFSVGAGVILFILYFLLVAKISDGDETEQEMFDRERKTISPQEPNKF